MDLIRGSLTNKKHFMTVIQYIPADSSTSIDIPVAANESVLEALENAGHAIPYGCRGGVCQSCLMQAAPQDTLPESAQAGLKQTQKAENFFLSCSCFPESKISCKLPQFNDDKIDAEVIDKTDLNDSVFRLRLKADIDYKAGQFVNLWKDDIVTRSYSLASTHQDQFLEFHIKRIENGAFSEWAYNNLDVGKSLTIQGPLGECFYSLEDKQQPLLLTGIGTGLAPLYGIVKDALQQGHTGNISLVIGGKHEDNFYYAKELATLSKQYSNFTALHVAQENSTSPTEPTSIEVLQGDVYETIKARFPSLKGYSVYLCGAESFVKKMKRQCYLQDAKLADIYSDAFIAHPS